MALALGPFRLFSAQQKSASVFNKPFEFLSFLDLGRFHFKSDRLQEIGSIGQSLPSFHFFCIFMA